MRKSLRRESLVMQAGGRWFNITVDPMRDKAGRLTGAVHIARDITEARKIEESLHESEEKYRLLAETTRDIILLHDLDGRITYVNRAGLEMTGFTPEEAVGKSVVDFIPAEQLAGLRERRDKRRAGEKGLLHYEAEFVDKHKRLVPVEVNSSPVVRKGKRTEVLIVARDITERKRAEQSLRRSEERFRRLAESSPIGIYIIQDGLFRYVNRTFLELTGYAEDEVVGRLGPVEMTHPDDRERIATALKLAAAGETTETRYEFRGLRKDGSVIYCEVHGRLTEFEGRAAFIGTIADVSKRVRAEERIRESEETYRNLFQNAQVGLFRTRISDGKILESNEQLARMFGYDTREEFIREYTTSGNYVDPGTREKMLALIKRDGHIENFEARFYRKDRSVFWARFTARIYPEKGWIEGVAEDITEHKKAVQLLLESEERYRNILDVAPVGIAVHQDGKIVFANPAGLALMGTQSPEDMVGKPIAEVIHPEGLETALDRIRRMLAGEKELYPVEDRYVRLDGKVIDVEVMASPLNYEGRPAVQVIVRDITEQKKAEDQKRRRLAELELLDKVTAALRQARSISEAVPILLRETLAAMAFPAGSVWLYDASTDELRMEAAEGWISKLPLKIHRPEEGIAGLVFSTGKSHVSADFSVDPATHPGLRAAVPPGWGGAAVPILALEGPIGVFFVSSPSSRAVHAEEVSLLESLARMAGIALQRMALYEETLRKFGQLQTMRTIDQTIANILDLRLALDIICAQAQEKLAVDAVGVLLFSPYELTLSWAAGRGFRGSSYGLARIKLGEGYAGRAALEQRTVVVEDIRVSEPPFRRLQALAAEGFVSYAAAPLVVRGQLKGLMEVFQRFPARRGKEWVEFFESLALQTAIAVDNLQLYENLQRSNVELLSAYEATIEGWARALDLRDKETEGHTRRVTELAEAVARAMDVPDAQILHLRRGAMLHDVGKIGVPDSILLKPGELTEEEWEVMRRHPVLAYEMLSAIEYLKPAVEIPYCHHEKWDGRGYPRGLKGEQIPLAARIFAVVDVFDALTSDRPYRKAWTRQKALDYIRKEAGRHFDPRVVEVFMRVVAEHESGRKS